MALFFYALPHVARGKFTGAWKSVTVQVDTSAFFKIIFSRDNTGNRNKKKHIVDRATFSQHQYGKAADIQIANVSPKKVAAYTETLLPNKGGIGIYGTFTHIDVRETKSRWNG